ncbi:MAG TPA: IPT/TIG domain-containing protein [Acidimicrobiales bacterium]|nr:IPT/TIG domain-containing protein [Acidimicrobiales bacterium]
MKRLSLLLCAAALPIGLIAAVPGIASATSTPTVIAVVPNHGPTAGGKKVTVIGTDFSGATAVDFGSTPSVFAVNSSKVITAVSPPGIGTVDVTVVTPDGTSVPASAGADLYHYDAHVPAVTKVLPAHGPTTGDTTVAIVGKNFSGATSVQFGPNEAESFTVNSDHAIVATSPAGTGTVDITVTSPNGTSSTSPADQFTYVLRVPTVQMLAPKRGSVNGGTKVTIFGTDLSGVTAVHFGATAGTIDSIDSNNSMVVTSPAGTGTVDVTVTDSNGTSPTDPSDLFTYVLNVPKVTLVVPNHGSTDGGTTVTIGGSGFSKVTGVDFGSTPAVFTINSGHAITATSPPGTGIVDVTVTNANGTSATSSADLFTYLTPAP